MEPLIITLSPKKLVGLSRQVSMGADEVATLWKQFAPLIKAIPNRSDANRINLSIFPPGFSFTSFINNASFNRWAVVEVVDHSSPTPPLQALTIAGGLYAMFTHRGVAADFAKTMQHIFTQWLPTSNYVLDNRPHFEILPPDYNPQSEEAEESIWIPVRKKAEPTAGE